MTWQVPVGFAVPCYLAGWYGDRAQGLYPAVSSQKTRPHHQHGALPSVHFLHNRQTLSSLHLSNDAC